MCCGGILVLSTIALAQWSVIFRTHPATRPSEKLPKEDHNHFRCQKEDNIHFYQTAYPFRTRMGRPDKSPDLEKEVSEDQIV